MTSKTWMFPSSSLSSSLSLLNNIEQQKQQSSSSISSSGSSMTMSGRIAIEEGTTEEGIPYLHCSSFSSHNMGRKNNNNNNNNNNKKKKDYKNSTNTNDNDWNNNNDDNEDTVIEDENENIIDILLLHGARFHKEDWKHSRIMEKLCSKDNVSVTAIDFYYGATHTQLKQFLDDNTPNHHHNNGKNNTTSTGRRQRQRQRQQVLFHHTLPIDAIVTPSASGKSIVGWIDTDISELVQYIHQWIPIASGSIMGIPKFKWKQLRTTMMTMMMMGRGMTEQPRMGTMKFSILAMHGSDDRNGKLISNRLEEETYSYAQIVQLNGSHECYLDSPYEFVQQLYSFVVKNKNTQN